ncbi:hypothetical protein Pst134EA_017204 [Puccinia striiformis f. sp. tritici]|uniref:hypothetical protein n=1 Tax=Puccinia striiformis f. sp. tritici TaxID=168172 RepID=UPI0020089F12|nr:hypothetical protein Pst134EA_017204 [Puccinia striiformis f. sp. tritici]KAH9460891.1 hypothetical protein Pst134EA_017204 [Puccinia striiformis f. sp. tritici]
MADVSPPVPMVRIQNQDRDLGFDGTNVEEFLYWYQKAAKEDGASEYDMARQLIRFIRSNKVYDIIKTCEGYINRNWSDLKASLIFYWGRLDLPPFTLQDIEALVQSWSARDATFSLQEFQTFRQSWDPIALYVLRDESIDTIDQISEKLQSLEHQLKNQSAVQSSQASIFDLNQSMCTAHTSFQPSQPPAELQEPQESETFKNPSIPSPLCSGTTQDTTLTVVESDEEEMDLKPKLSDRSIEEPIPAEDPREAGLPISIAMMSPTEPLVSCQIPEGLGEDHNYFIEKSDSSDCSSIIEPSFFDKSSIPDQEPSHLPNIIMPLSQSSDPQKSSDTTQIIRGISIHPGRHHLGPLSSTSTGPLRDENKLPLFHFEEDVGSFSDRFTVFHLNEEQDHSFPEPVSPFQARLRDEDKLSCSKLGRKEEAKWRNWGTKVSPPNCASPRLDTPLVVETLSCATYVSKTLLLPLSFDSALLGQIAAPLLKEKAPATQSIQGLNTQQYLLVQSLSSNEDLDHQSPISGSRFNGVGHIRLFIFVKPHGPNSRFTRNQETPPFPHHLFLLTEHQFPQARSPENNQAFDLFNFSFPPSPPLVACKIQKSNHLAINSIKTIPPSFEVFSFCGSFNHHLDSSFQHTFMDSFATIAGDLISLFDLSGGRGLAWNRSGIGPNHVFPSEDFLRNEDKLLSFYWNSRGSLPEEALEQRSKSSHVVCIARIATTVCQNSTFCHVCERWSARLLLSSIVFVFVFWSIDGLLSKSRSTIKVGKSSSRQGAHHLPWSIIKVGKRFKAG